MGVRVEAGGSWIDGGEAADTVTCQAVLDHGNGMGNMYVCVYGQAV